MSLTIKEMLDRSRRELLDLSTRNRLLSIPVNSKAARMIQVHDELSEQVFRLLVGEKKSLSFLPGKESVTDADNMGRQEGITDDEEIGLPQPEEDEDLVNGVARRHIDNRLQTSLSPEGLQRRLLNLYHDALTTIEEQGVNILYLALGHLQWREAEQADVPRYAPLILVPVELYRKSAGERFYCRWREEDIQENLSLASRMKQDFGLEIPSLPKDDEDLSPTEYFAQVKALVAGANGWDVLPDAITLGFFSFSKFLMYRDLDSESWSVPSRLLDHPFVTALLQDGFPKSDQVLSEETQLDEVIPVSRLDHVVDADSSQTVALEMIRQGKSVVIQGPPGTGKSQSITNIIATAVIDGKKVLFVAEKLAALEVVKSRLEREGLGPLCLELHSNKSNKRAVIEDIGRTWRLGRPRLSHLEGILPKLETTRDSLNRHANGLHTPHRPSGLTPFNVIGKLVSLGDRGHEAGSLVIEGCESWSREEYAARRSLLADIAERIQRIGIPSQHPWRGVHRGTVLRIDLPEIESAIRVLAESLVELNETSERIANLLTWSKPNTLAEVEIQTAQADYIGKTPGLDRQALCDSVWEAGLDRIGNLVRNGETFTTILNRNGNTLAKDVWRADFSDLRHHVATSGNSWLRFLKRDYRAAIKRFRGFLTAALPKSYSERLDLLDEIVGGQQAYRVIGEQGHLGESAFGKSWLGEMSDWGKLRAIVEWYSQHEAFGLRYGFQQIVAQVDDTKELLKLSGLLRETLQATERGATRVQEILQLDVQEAFGAESPRQIVTDILLHRCQEWLEQPEGLSRWGNYYASSEKAKALGLADLIIGLDSGRVLATGALDCFDRAYFGQILRAMVHDRPELAHFDGELHDALVSTFQKLDRERLDLARHRVLLAHFDRMPASSGVGQAGVVKSEIERKRGHRSVRKLLRDAGSIVQSIKPVFMMSPLSVAQFLEPGAVEFDLLVIDEASQVQPVDAFGAIARCSQVVVVGDHKQLPPTRFFARLTADSSEIDGDDVIETAEAKDIESILGLCCARGLSETMLRWHYRSRHHSLIAVSNHEFYDDRLFIVPSPYSASSGLGLRFHYIKEGVFDSGASRTNRIEARAICRAVVDHVRKTPNLSLGVAAFSTNQRQAIIDELELMRRQDPELEPFFSSHPADPFFVKNLENVQGDERDVIFISIGYARDVHGYMAMRFGPLSVEGGERRLNVLISRAKLRCDVFSSITADDIDLERASGRGVVALKGFLSFAQTGIMAVAKRSGLDEQSPFEEAVRRAIESLGYEVQAQIGIAGFFVDLAIVDPERPGRYLLGIECDGATYHSSRSARDRDRLRQAVLEQHGWTIHRIWSTDWFQRPSEQLQKVVAAIEQAKCAQDAIDPLGTKGGGVVLGAGPGSEIEREAIAQFEKRGLDKISIPYSETRFAVPKGSEPHMLTTRQMADVVLKIVEHEGPIHETEVINRVRNLWKLARAGSKTQSAVKKSIRSLLTHSSCRREGGFLCIQNAEVRVRNRENVSSSNLRRPEMISPKEISQAILRLLEMSHGARRDEIPVPVARILGFKSTSIQLREVVEASVTELLKEGRVQEKDDTIGIVDDTRIVTR